MVPCCVPTLPPDASALVHRGRTGRGLARLRLLETYSRALLAAGERVSRSPVLTGFFAPQPTDLEPALPPGRCLTPPHHTTDSAGRSIWRMGEARWRESQSRRPHPPSALASRVILPTLEEPLPGPTGSLAIHSLEAQSLRCLQPFSTQDVWGQPFYAGAQEALGVLLRHPSGESGDTPFCPWGPSRPQDLKHPAPWAQAGGWLSTRTSRRHGFLLPTWRRGPPAQDETGIGAWGATVRPIPLPTPTTTTTGPCLARTGRKKYPSQEREAVGQLGGDSGPAVCVPQSEPETQWVERGPWCQQRNEQGKAWRW